MPKRLEFESRPFFVLPAPFLCAVLQYFKVNYIFIIPTNNYSFSNLMICFDYFGFTIANKSKNDFLSNNANCANIFKFKPIADCLINALARL